MTAMTAELCKSSTAAETQAQTTGRCLYCQGTRLSPLWRHVRDRLQHVPGEWGFDQCRDCGSLRLTPMPAEAELASFYPRVYSFSRDLGGESPLRRFFGRVEDRCFYRPQYAMQASQVLRGIGYQGQAGLTMLDIGCGRGLRLSAFARCGFDVHGLDLQPEAIESLRRDLGIPGTVGSISDLDSVFEPQSFDLITAFYVLEHVPDVAVVLEHARRLLRPRGWFVGVVPVCDGIQARLFGRHWLHVTEAPRHLSLPSTRGLLRAAELTGYQQIRIRPDSLLNCAGIVGGSLFPGSDLTSAYGRARWLALVKRLLGGVCAIGSLPLCYVENYVLGHTSHAMLFARRP